MCANSPTPALSILRRNAKIRWILETFLRDEIDAFNAASGFPSSGPLSKYRLKYPRIYVGVQLSALESSNSSADVLPAISVFSVTDGAEPSDSGSRADLRTVLGIEAIDDLDAGNLQGSAMRAQSLALVARDCLYKYIVDTDSDVAIFSATLLDSNGGTPGLVRAEATTVSVQADLEIISHVNAGRVFTAAPSIALVPYEPSLGKAPSITLSCGAATLTLAGGTGGNLSVAGYASGGLEIECDHAATGQLLTLIRQPGPSTHTVSLDTNPATVTSSNLSAINGDVWTLTGVHPLTSTILSYFIRWTA
jgi:hypothetical protein